MLLLYGSQAAWDALTPAEWEELGRAHREVQAELRGSGELISTGELSVDDARTVRAGADGPVVRPGPSSEGEQILGGWYLVECADVDHATEIAGRFTETRFAPVEVRVVKG